MLVLSSFSDVTCPSFLKFQFACCSLHPFTFILFLYVCYNRYNMYVGLGLVFFVSFNWSTRMTYRECITMIGYILLLKEKKRVPISKFFPQVLIMARPDTKPRVQHSTQVCPVGSRSTVPWVMGTALQGLRYQAAGARRKARDWNQASLLGCGSWTCILTTRPSVHSNMVGF